MGNAAGCSVCGSEVLTSGHGSDNESNHRSDLYRAAGSGCDNDGSAVRSGDNGADHQLFS